MDGLTRSGHVFDIYTIAAVSSPLSFDSDGCVLDMDSILVKR